MTLLQSNPGFLLLEDGTLFSGQMAPGSPVAVAEVVFTTNMSGYQEVFTDPSYRGQILVMTAPMIGLCFVLFAPIVGLVMLAKTGLQALRK